MSSGESASDRRPKSRSNLSVRQVRGEVIVLDRQSNRVHQFNETAGFVWRLCDGQHSLRRISDEMAETYRVDRGVARRDAARLIQEFYQLGLLELPVPSVLKSQDCKEP